MKIENGGCCPAKFQSFLVLTGSFGRKCLSDPYSVHFSPLGYLRSENSSSPSGGWRDPMFTPLSVRSTRDRGGPQPEEVPGMGKGNYWRYHGGETWKRVEPLPEVHIHSDLLCTWSNSCKRSHFAESPTLDLLRRSRADQISM